MTRAKPALKLVAPHSTERLIREAFECEEDALRQLAHARQLLKRARRMYADEHGLLMLPSFETLRKVVHG